MFLPYDFMLTLNMCVLGLRFANTADEYLSSSHKDRLVDFYHEPIYVMNYKICNILCLNKSSYDPY